MALDAPPFFNVRDGSYSYYTDQLIQLLMAMSGKVLD